MSHRPITRDSRALTQLTALPGRSILLFFTPILSCHVYSTFYKNVIKDEIKLYLIIGENSIYSSFSAKIQMEPENMFELLM
mgnify:CR=1 FL=1